MTDSEIFLAALRHRGGRATPDELFRSACALSPEARASWTTLDVVALCQAMERAGRVTHAWDSGRRVDVISEVVCA